MRGILKSFLLVFIFFIPLGLRAYLEVEKNLQVARLESDPNLASEAYRRALSWAFLSKNELAAEFFGFCSKLDATPQLHCLWELKAGAQGSRSIVWPRLEILDQVQAKISDLSPKPETYFESVHKPKVNFTYQIFAQIGFWGWLVSVVYLIFNGFNAQGKLLNSAKKLFALVVLFYLIWLWALGRA